MAIETMLKGVPIWTTKWWERVLLLVCRRRYFYDVALDGENIILVHVEYRRLWGANYFTGRKETVRQL